MMSSERSLYRAVAGYALHRTPARLRAAVASHAWEGVEADLAEAPNELRREVAEVVARLVERGVTALLIGGAGYPAKLARSTHRPPALFALGDLTAVEASAVGICGSRKATEAGIGAAEGVGALAAGTAFVLVAGNARGVDRAAQNAAIDAGGRVVAVLPEGMLASSVREDDVPRGSLVLSEFPPRQPWSVAAAMERNKTIVALSEALIVVEPGERGGTFEAGLEGLRRKGPVYLLATGDDEAPGVTTLAAKGASRVSSLAALQELLAGEERTAPTQGSLWE